MKIIFIIFSFGTVLPIVESTGIRSFTTYSSINRVFIRSRLNVCILMIPSFYCSYCSRNIFVRIVLFVEPPILLYRINSERTLVRLKIYGASKLLIIDRQFVVGHCFSFFVFSFKYYYSNCFRTITVRGASVKIYERKNCTNNNPAVFL